MASQEVLCHLLGGAQQSMVVEAGETVGRLVGRLLVDARIPLANRSCGDVVLVRGDGGAVSKVEGHHSLASCSLAKDDSLVILRPIQRPIPLSQRADGPSAEAIEEFVEQHHADTPPDPSHTGATAAADAEFTYTTVLNALTILWHWSSVLHAAGEGQAEGGQEEEEEEEGDTSYSQLVDPSALQALLSVGFPENRCIKALVLSQMDPSIAMEWLLTHESDPNIDTPLSPPPKTSRRKKGDPSAAPDPLLFQRLKDMGFGAPDVDAALRLAHNNFDQACDLLLQGVDVRAELAKHETKVADIESPLSREIMKEPSVHAALANPAVRNAIAEMIRDTNTISPFLYDPLVGPMLRTIMNILREMPPGDI